MSSTTTTSWPRCTSWGCILAPAGIAPTTSVYLRNNRDGTFSAETRLVIGRTLPDHRYPGGWGYAGPVLIAGSVITGLAGNLVWLLSS